jgi:hypothetical protein
MSIRLRERFGVADGLRIGSSQNGSAVDGQVVVVCRPCGRILGRDGVDRIFECHPGAPLARARRDNLRMGGPGVVIGLVEAMGQD